MELKELYEISKKELDEIIENKNPDFRLEQAEFDKKEKTWDIVVSFLKENLNKRISIMNSIGGDFPYERIYKKIKFNENKEFLGFYIYDSK